MTTAFRRALSAARAIGAASIASLSVAMSTVAQGSDAADEALKKGGLAEAKAQFEQAVKRNPADYNAVISYASTLPPKEALKLADSLSRVPNVPEWVKARGLRISGDHHFLKEEYKKAAEAYLQASALDSGASMYKHLYALSIAMDGQTEAARAIWNKITQNKTDELSGEASRISALLPKPAATEAPTVSPQPAAPVNPPNNTPVSIPANTVSIQTNTAGKADTVKTPSTPTAPAAPPVAAPVNPKPNNTPVSIPVNTAVKADTVKTPSASTNPPAAPVNTKPTGPLFTIQVGAFASKENADNLVKRLTGKYDDITVSTTGSGDQTLYRVRVGTFPKKEDAAAFADKLIIEAGLSARVTEK